MNLRIFQKFDPWGMHRLVWEKPKEEPAYAPAVAPAAPTQTPEAAATAAAKQAAEGAVRAASSRRDEQGKNAAAEAILQGGGAASGQATAAPAEATEKAETIPTFAEFTEKFKQYGDEYLALMKEKDPAKRREKMAQLLESIPSEEKAMLESFYESFLGITVKEQEEFRKKYFQGEQLNFDVLANGATKLTDREKLVLLSVLKQEDIDKLIEQNKFPPETALYFAQIQSVLPELETRQKLAHFDELVRSDAYAAAYKTFVENPNKKDPTALRQEFLAVFKNQKDKEIVEWALTADPTAVERQFVLKQKLKGIKLTPKEIDAQVKEGKLNFREGQIALALIEEKDVDEFANAGKINAEEAAQLRDIIRSHAPEAPGSAIPDSIKGLGIVGALEKLIDLLTKLADKISGAIEKMFKKKGVETQEKGFAKSPLGVDEKGEDKKFKLNRQYEAGKGVAIEAAPQAQIFAVERGAVSVNNNVVTITLSPTTRIEYRNVKVAEGVTGQTLDAGTQIGTAGGGGTFELQVFDNNEEKNPTALLEPYIIQEAAPAAPAVVETPAATTPTASAAAPAAAPAAAEPPNAPTQTQAPAAPAAAPAPKAEATPAAAPQAPKKPWWKFWG